MCVCLSISLDTSSTTSQENSVSTTTSSAKAAPIPTNSHSSRFSPHKVLPSAALNMSPPSYSVPPLSLLNQVTDPNIYVSATNISQENVFETAARLLFMSVKWARNIPSFLQQPFRDQAILLEEAWCELFILSTSQWSLPIDVCE